MSEYNDEIVYTEEMLEKTLEISTWVEELSTALECSSTVLTNLPDVYYGQASEDLDLYYSTMNTHLSSLVMLYSAAIEYSMNTYLEIMGIDQTMAEYRAAMGAGGDGGEEEGEEEAGTGNDGAAQNETAGTQKSDRTSGDEGGEVSEEAIADENGDVETDIETDTAEEGVPEVDNGNDDVVPEGNAAEDGTSGDAGGAAEDEGAITETNENAETEKPSKERRGRRGKGQGGVRRGGHKEGGGRRG